MQTGAWLNASLPRAWKLLGDTWKLPRIKEELANGAGEITVEVDGGDSFKVTHDFAPKEREILIEGGLLHWLQEHGEKAQ